MALPPHLRPLIIAGTPDAPHTLDIFLDYVCPYSAKLALTIDSVLVPLLGPGGEYHGKVKVIYRHQVQPWHASSTLVNEAGLAVARASPESFWPFSLRLFQAQNGYFDTPTANEAPEVTRGRLANLLETILPSAKKPFLDLVALKGGNGGNAVTDDLKYTIKFSRQNGVHVSPTVLWDGLIENKIESSFTEKDWKDFLGKRVIL
ncbi:hypothetical protein DFH07DRAFT_735015 [Mycena maculata]|uniref:Thioredoxin-like fold domain-containing protein n=1 Tax=Mycena maculata TaxID=230809 RepID=A0AAD7JUS8_9AGAR|nr:hypothetical protein DFH07DRAFT_735015 [Mycena maculata]